MAKASSNIPPIINPTATPVLDFKNIKPITGILNVDRQNPSLPCLPYGLFPGLFITSHFYRSSLIIKDSLSF